MWKAKMPTYPWTEVQAEKSITIEANPLYSVDFAIFSFSKMRKWQNKENSLSCLSFLNLYSNRQRKNKGSYHDEHNKGIRMWKKNTFFVFWRNFWFFGQNLQKRQSNSWRNLFTIINNKMHNAKRIQNKCGFKIEFFTRLKQGFYLRNFENLFETDWTISHATNKMIIQFIFRILSYY